MAAVEYEDSFRSDGIWDFAFEIRNDTDLDCDDINTLSDTEKTGEVMETAGHISEVPHKSTIASCDPGDPASALSCPTEGGGEGALQPTASCPPEDAHQSTTPFPSTKQASTSAMESDIGSKVASPSVKPIPCGNRAGDPELGSDSVTDSATTFTIDPDFDSKGSGSAAQSPCDTKVLQPDPSCSGNRGLSSTQPSAILPGEECCSESCGEAQSQTTGMSESAQTDLETSRNRLTHAGHPCVPNVSTGSADLMISASTSTNTDEPKTVAFTTDSFSSSNSKLDQERAYADLIPARLSDDATATDSLGTVGVDGPPSILKRQEASADVQYQESFKAGTRESPIDLDAKPITGESVCAMASNSQHIGFVALPCESVFAPEQQRRKSRGQKRRHSVADDTPDLSLEKRPRRSDRPRKNLLYIEWTDERVSKEVESIMKEISSLEANYLAQLEQLDVEFEKRSERLEERRSMLETLTRRLGIEVD